jgi:hypothetical protein
MRGSIRKWWVMGALTSAALLFPGCSDTNRGMDTGVQDPMGTGSVGGAGMTEDLGGTGGSGIGGTGIDSSGIGGSGGAEKGAKGGGARDAGTPGPADAGTGGAGLEGSQETGSSGQGVSGDEGVTNTRTPSGGIPTK